MTQTLSKEEQATWDTLSTPTVNSTTVTFKGNGIATKFNSGWVSGSKVLRITVNDVAQSNFIDFRIQANDIVFKYPPAKDDIIHVEVY